MKKLSCPVQQLGPEYPTYNMGYFGYMSGMLLHWIQGLSCFSKHAKPEKIFHEMKIP